MIHPAGLGGSPVDGHRCTAAANASWTASSATSMSPNVRTRTATARPYSFRKTRSISMSDPGGFAPPDPPARSLAGAPGPAPFAWLASLRSLASSMAPRRSVFLAKRANFDRERRRQRELAAPVERGVEIGRLDDAEAADVFLAFGERSVRREHLAALDAYDGGSAGCVQAGREDPRAGCLHLVADRLHVAHDFLEGRRRGRFTVGLIHAEQVLLHMVLVEVTAGPMPASHPLHERLRSGSTLATSETCLSHENGEKRSACIHSRFDP